MKPSRPALSRREWVSVAIGLALGFLLLGFLYDLVTVAAFPHLADIRNGLRGSIVVIIRPAQRSPTFREIKISDTREVYLSTRSPTAAPQLVRSLRPSDRLWQELRNMRNWCQAAPTQPFPFSADAQYEVGVHCRDASDLRRFTVRGDQMPQELRDLLETPP